MTKQKAIIIGNCQANVLCRVLNHSKNLTNLFDIEIGQPVHLLASSEVKVIHENLNTCSLLITQRISENYRNSIGLGFDDLKRRMQKDFQIITFLSAYWKGYNPELCYLYDGNNKNISDCFDYHHAVVFTAYTQSMPKEKTVKLLNSEQVYNFLASSEQSFQELQEREKALDTLSSTQFLYQLK